MFALFERRFALSPAKNIAIPGVGSLDLVLHDRADIWISDVIRRGDVFDPHVLSMLREFIKPGDHALIVGNAGRDVGVTAFIYNDRQEGISVSEPKSKPRAP